MGKIGKYEKVKKEDNVWQQNLSVAPTFSYKKAKEPKLTFQLSHLYETQLLLKVSF